MGVCAGPGGQVGAIDPAHKAVVMRCLQAQCENGQLLVDLFVNYDCDLEGANLFERMVLALVRIAQGGQTDKDDKSQVAIEESHLRLSVRTPLLDGIGFEEVGRWGRGGPRGGGGGSWLHR